jgi:hypothetical protein
MAPNTRRGKKDESVIRDKSIDDNIIKKVDIVKKPSQHENVGKMENVEKNGYSNNNTFMKNGDEHNGNNKQKEITNPKVKKKATSCHCNLF